MKEIEKYFNSSVKCFLLQHDEGATERVIADSDLMLEKRKLEREEWMKTLLSKTFQWPQSETQKQLGVLHNSQKMTSVINVGTMLLFTGH